VFMLGEDIGLYGGAFKVTEGFLDRFGASRVIDTPIAEAAIVGAAAGAAHMGLRPVAEMQFIDFISCAYDMLTNYVATARYRAGLSTPMLVRGPCGGYVRGGPVHSQNVEAAFFHTPRLKSVYPDTAPDAKRLGKSTIRALGDAGIMRSVKKTNKLLIVHEDTRTGGLAGEIAARVNEQAFEWLDGPIMRVTAHDVPLPYAPTLEDFVLPQTGDIVKAARWLAAY